MKETYARNNPAAKAAKSCIPIPLGWAPGNVILKAHTQKTPGGAADKFLIHHM